MSTKAKQKKKTTGTPLQSTGSTDEYETDDFSPSEESDTDNVAAASYNNRSDDYNGSGTPAATMRGGARSSQRGKISSSKKKKKNSFTNSGASKKGGKKKSSIGVVELLSSEEEEDDSYEGDTETYDKKKSSRKGRAKRNNNNSEDDADNDMEEESNKNNKRGRRALGHINDNKSNTSKSPVNGGDSSEGEGEAANNTNNDDDSDDDSDPFANLGRGSNKRQKLQQKKNKGSDDDSDSDSDDSDSDDSSMGMGLGRNRSAQLAKRRQKMMATHSSYSSSDDDDDSSDSDDSLSDKKKKKKPAARKKSALDDSDSSISFLGTQSRKNPSRNATKSPQKKPAPASSNKQAAGNKGKRKSSILDTSCEILSSDDDDFGLPQTITTTTTTARSSSRKQPPVVAAASSKKPMSQDERDPSVRKASTKALDEARKAREALKAAQQYKAKEAVLPPIDVDIPSSLTTSRSRTGGGGGMEVVDVDMISSFPSRPSVPVQISYIGPRITLTLRYQNPTTKKESKANIKIKTDQPLQHLVDEFKTQQPRLEITTVKFDGQNLSLKNTPAFYEMEDEDLVDVVVVVKQQNTTAAPSFFGGLASRAAQALGVRSPPGAQAVTLATIHVQTRGNQSQKHTFQIKNDAPLSKVVTAYCEKYDLISIKLEHNGRMLDSNKSLSAEGLPNEVQLDAVVLVQGGPSIKLKFRANGKAADITTLSIPMKLGFESIMGRFAQKKNLSLSQCKFIFDGETLNPNSTPEGLDLEGDEIIDVRIPVIHNLGTH